MGSLLTASFIARTGALLVLSLCTFSTAHGALHITEFMADNGDSNLDGDAFDWIGIFNAGSDSDNVDGPATVTFCIARRISQGQS